MTKFEFKPREDWQLTPEVLIPATHLHLHAVQVFLPYNYEDMGGHSKRVRWSEIIAARASSSWNRDSRSSRSCRQHPSGFPACSSTRTMPTVSMP